MDIDDLSRDVNRIEQKVDRLSEAVVALARLDERLAGHIEENRRLGERLERCEVSLVTLREDVMSSKVKLGFWERLGWILIAALMGFLGWFPGHL